MSKEVEWASRPKSGFRPRETLMKSELLHLIDLLLSEFEDQPFSFEEALDYMDLKEKELLNDLRRIGFLIPAGKDRFRIADADFFFQILEEDYFHPIQPGPPFPHKQDLRPANFPGNLFSTMPPLHSLN